MPQKDGAAIPLRYDLVGALAPDWRKGRNGMVIAGSIRASAFDPWAPTGTVGAFVLVPIGEEGTGS